MIQLAGIRIVAVRRLIADEEIQPAIAVVIEPGGGLGGMLAVESHFLGYVGEGSVPPLFRRSELGMRPALPSQPPRKIQTSIHPSLL